MAYLQETCICGKVIEIKKYYAWGIGNRSNRRQKKTKRTKETVAAANRRRAIDTLRRKLNTGCRGGDIHLVLTYKEAVDPEQAKRELHNYIRRLIRLYQSEGVELRWIAVTEYENKRIHHHLVINQGVDLKKIADTWKNGRTRFALLDDDGQYAALAEYLVKETDKTFREPDAVHKKRWTCSRNWPKPKITKQIIRADSWRKEPKAKKGYMIEKERTTEGVTDAGYGFQFYSMVRIC